MKKYLHILFIASVVASSLIACDKDENLGQYNSIAGQLTANENMTAADFGEFGVSLVKLHDNVNPDLVTSKTVDFDIIETAAVKQDGSFAFDSLDNGIYLVALTEGFIFPVDTFVILPLYGGTTFKTNKSVNRVHEENSPKIYDVILTNNIKLELKKILFYYGDEHYKTVDISNLSNVNNSRVIGGFIPGDTSNPVTSINSSFSIMLDKGNDVSFRLEYIKDGETHTTGSIGFFYLKRSYPLDWKSQQANDGFQFSVSKFWFLEHTIKLN